MLLRYHREELQKYTKVLEEVTKPSRKESETMRAKKQFDIDRKQLNIKRVS